MGIGIEDGRMTRHEAATARLALQPLLDKATALRIRHAASPEAADQHVADAATEVVAVLEKHLSTLSNQ